MCIVVFTLLCRSVLRVRGQFIARREYYLLFNSIVMELRSLTLLNIYDNIPIYYMVHAVCYLTVHKWTIDKLE